LSPEKSRGGLRTWHCFGLLFVAVFGVYLNALGNGLVDFDDAVVLHPKGAFGLVATKRLAEDFRHSPTRALQTLAVARPLSGLTQTLDTALFGDDHWGHHLSSVAYHFLTCCFAFLLGVELLRSRSAGLAAALIFALHPVQTESVAYLAGRRDVLYGLLSLASIYYWLRGLRSGSRAATAGAVALWALAMTAKPAAITVPLLWLAASAAAKPEEFKAHLRRNAAIYLGCAAACAAVLLAHILVDARQSRKFGLPAELSWYGGNAAAQWATEPRIVLHALKLLLWPVTLSADYSLQVFEPSRSFLEPKVLLALACCAAALWLAWAMVKRRPLMSFALVWIALAYAPMLHILPSLHNNETFAEHWLYLPLFGFALLAAGLLENIRRFHRAYWAGLALLLCLYAGRAVHRNRDWKDAMTLWSKTAATYPECGRAQGILGRTLLVRGNLPAAETALRKALELRPDDPKHHLNLADLYRSTGRFKEAEQVLRLALKSPLAPMMQADIYFSLDLLYAQSGRQQLIRRPFHDDRDRAAWNPRALILSGTVMASQGDAALAEKAFVRALATAPDSAAAQYNIGFLYYNLRHFDLAARAYEKLLQKYPSSLQARIYLALAYSEAGEPDRARLALDQALKAAPKSVEVWLAISNFHLKRKAIPEALGAARKAAHLEKSPRTERQLYLVYRES